MSYRLSFMRPVVFDPGAFGEYGGPANGGFAGTGTNNSYSSAVTWTRVISAKTVLDVRGGLNYYRNVTSTTGQGLTTSTDVGIPGANLNDFTSGISQHQHQQLHRPAARLLGQPALGSLGEDLERHRDTDAAAQHRTPSSSAASCATTATCCCRPRMPAARAAGSPSTLRAPAARPRARHTSSPANSMAVVPARLAEQRCQRDLKVFDDPGTKHWASSWFVQDKWQARSNVTVDLGLRWEYYQPLVGPRGQGRSGELRPRRSTRSASPATAIRTTR